MPESEVRTHATVALLLEAMQPMHLMHLSATLLGLMALQLSGAPCMQGPFKGVLTGLHLKALHEATDCVITAVAHMNEELAHAPPAADASLEIQRAVALTHATPPRLRVPASTAAEVRMASPGARSLAHLLDAVSWYEALLDALQHVMPAILQHREAKGQAAQDPHGSDRLMGWVIYHGFQLPLRLAQWVSFVSGRGLRDVLVHMAPRGLAMCSDVWTGPAVVDRLQALATDRAGLEAYSMWVAQQHLKGDCTSAALTSAMYGEELLAFWKWSSNTASFLRLQLMAACSSVASSSAAAAGSGQCQLGAVLSHVASRGQPWSMHDVRAMLQAVRDGASAGSSVNK